MVTESARLLVPSEVVLPLAGYLVFLGKINFWTAFSGIPWERNRHGDRLCNRLLSVAPIEVIAFFVAILALVLVIRRRKQSLKQVP